jgi:hypothetical protein
MSEQVRGRVNIPGTVAEDADVVVADASGSFIGSVPVGPDGAFTLPAVTGGTRLLARIRRPVVAFGTVTVPPGRADVTISVGSAWPRLTVRLSADVTSIPPVTMFIDPVVITAAEDLPADLFLQRAPGVFDAHYSELPIPGEGTSLRVAAGTYRIGGGHLNYDRPMSTIPLPPNVITHQLLSGPHHEVCPGDPWSGFTVTVSDDTAVVLVLREVADPDL